MSPHHRRERLLQRLQVQRPSQPNDERQVVRIPSRVELPEEPQALLRERQRHRGLPRHSRWHRGAHSLPACLHGLQSLGQRFHGGRFEHPSHRHITTERRAEPRHHARRQQRMTTEREEVVLHAHPRHAEQRRPDARHQRLHHRPRPLHRLRARPVLLRRRQGLSVHLPIRSQRQRRQLHEGRGHHELGQLLLQPVPHPRCLGRLRLFDVVRDQALASRAIPHHHQPVLHRWMREERCLHFGQLDAVAPHLHLAVPSAQELQHSIGTEARQVSSAIEPLSWHRAERIRNEAVRRHIGLAQIPSREAITTDVQLSRHAHWNGLHPSIQHIDLRVADGPANGHRRAHVLHSRHPMDRREERALRRPVAGRHRNLQLLQYALHVRRGHHVSTCQELADSLQPVHPQLHHLAEQARRQVQQRDGVPMEHVRQQVQLAGRTRREDDQPSTQAQRSPHLQRRRIEGDGRDEQERLLRPQSRVGRAVQQPQHASVLHGHALGPPRASRREVHVRQVPTRHRHARRRRRQVRQSLLLQQHQLGTSLLGQLRQQGTRGDEQPRRRVLQHLLQPPRRIAGVQGHIRTTRLQDGQQRYDELHRALQAHRHQHIHAHATRLQRPRQLIGPSLQLPIAQPLLTELQRHRVRPQRHLLFEEVMDAALARELHRRLVPRLQHALAFVRRQERKRRQPRLRSAGEVAQQLQEALRDALDSGRLEEVRVVDELPFDSGSRCVDQQQLQVELGDGAREVPGARGDTRQREQRRGLLQGEEHLEQRRAAQVPLRTEVLHQSLEGHVLVRERSQHRLLRLTQEHLERGRRIRLCSQGQRVHEEAHQALRLPRRPPRHG